MVPGEKVELMDLRLLEVGVGWGQCSEKEAVVSTVKTEMHAQGDV